MQSAKIQKDKLRLIEKIIQSNDKEIIDYMNSFFSESDSVYQLSEDQRHIVRESTENYLSGKDKGKSWEEVKSKLLSKRNG
jgi:hypothetical protein